MSNTTPTGELETVAWMHTDKRNTTTNPDPKFREEYGYYVPLVRKSDALAHNEAVRGAAQALIDRWDVPLTGMSDVTPDEAIERLRAALLASQGEK